MPDDDQLLQDHYKRSRKPGPAVQTVRVASQNPEEQVGADRVLDPPLLSNIRDGSYPGNNRSYNPLTCAG
jgi:hypothetical protein